MEANIRRIATVLFFFGLWALDYGLIYAQTYPDPIAAKLQVNGEIEIRANRSLRLKPVEGPSMPSPAARGDLYFNGTQLFTCNNEPACTLPGHWEIIAEQGHIFYNDANAALYYYDSSEARWKLLGSAGAGGPKTVASRVVATKDSLGGGDYICNGSADGVGDQKEINDAIAEVGAAHPVSGRGGGAVYLLEGTYEITGPINISQSRVSLIGSGKGTVLKVKSGSNFNLINVNNVQGALISQLGLDGDSKSGVKGIYCSSVTYSKIHKVWIENMNDTGVYMYTSSDNIISDNYIKGNGTGINIQGGSLRNIILENNVLDNDYDGINCLSSYSVVSHNNIQGNNTDGIYIVGSSVSVTANNIINNKNNGCVIYNSKSVSVTDNTIYGNSYDGIKIDHMEGASYQSNYHAISGNNIKGNLYCGIHIAKGNYNVLFSNLIYDNGGTGDYSGIKVEDGYNLISSNYISDTAGNNYGIDISGEGNYLVSNHVVLPWTNSLGAIYDTGTGTSYTDKTKLSLRKEEISLASALGPPDFSYQSVEPLAVVSFDLTIGINPGQLRIIKNKGPNSMTIEDMNDTNIMGNIHPNKLRIDQNDVLTLIWNGSRWVEIAFSDN